MAYFWKKWIDEVLPENKVVVEIENRQVIKILDNKYFEIIVSDN